MRDLYQVALFHQRRLNPEMSGLEQPLERSAAAVPSLSPLALTPGHEPVRFVDLRSVGRHATSQTNEGVIRRRVICVRETKELALRLRIDPAHPV